MTVGSRVVCVDDKFDPVVAQFYVALPEAGQVYQIRRMMVGISPTGEEGEICVLLQELVNPRSNKPPFPERGFKIERFRELEELTTTDSEREPEAVPVGHPSTQARPNPHYDPNFVDPNIPDV